MAVRKWSLGRARAAYPSLKAVIGELTLEEVIAALELERSTLRRRSLIDRLISRAVRLNEISFTNHLKEKYHHG